jgi:hypothetical protein
MFDKLFGWVLKKDEETTMVEHVIGVAVSAIPVLLAVGLLIWSVAH